MLAPYVQHKLFDPLRDGNLSQGLILDLCPTYGDTVTASGGLISQIKDRSPYANHFSSVTSKPPTLTTSDPNYGGRPSISFGGAQELESTAPVVGLSGSGAVTHAIVYRLTSSSGNSALYQMGVVYPPTNGDLFDVLSGGTARQLGWRAGGLQFSNTASNTINTTYRSVVTYNMGAAVPVGVHYRNGVQVSTNSGSSGTGATFGSGDAWMLGSINNSEFWNGTIARFLSWNRLLSSTEIATLDTGLRLFFFQ